MKLQILIPQYKEPTKVIKPLLDSLQLQRGINFNDIGVIIVNDGSDILLSRDFLEQYDFEIQYHRNEHRGVSATRNMALDLANADYVMFCDADDCFINSVSLYNLFCIMDEDFDVLTSAFVEEVKHDNEFRYWTREKDRVFVHGKIFNRKYLCENDIRFDETLTVHEDHYFVELALSCTGRLKYVETPFYLWCWRDDSVCRKDKDYIFKTYVNHVDGTDKLTEALFNRTKIRQAQKIVVEFVYNLYYILNKSSWQNDENLLPTLKRFREFYSKWEHLFCTCSERFRAATMQAVRKRMVDDEGFTYEKITFDNWLAFVLSLQ